MGWGRDGDDCEKARERRELHAAWNGMHRQEDSFSWGLGLAVFGNVVFSTIALSAQKGMNNVETPVCDGCRPAKFDSPLLQMLVGGAISVVLCSVGLTLQARYPRSLFSKLVESETDRRMRVAKAAEAEAKYGVWGKGLKDQALLLTLSSLSVLASFLCYSAMTVLSPSTVLLLRSLIVMATTYIQSVRYARPLILRDHIAAVLAVLAVWCLLRDESSTAESYSTHSSSRSPIASFIPNLSSFSNREKRERHVIGSGSLPLVSTSGGLARRGAVGMILVSCVFSAVKILMEEELIRGQTFSVVQMAFMPSVYGLLSTLAMLAFPSQRASLGKGYFQIRHSQAAASFFALFLAASLAFGISNAYLTQKLGGFTRSLIVSVKTAAAYGADLAQGYVVLSLANALAVCFTLSSSAVLFFLPAGIANGASGGEYKEAAAPGSRPLNERILRLAKTTSLAEPLIAPGEAEL